MHRGIVVMQITGRRQYGPKPWTETAIASSGLHVTYSVSGPVRIAGVSPNSPSALTLNSTALGHVVITAHQPGNANFLPAADAVFEFNILMGAPALNWAIPAPVRVGTVLSSAPLNATANIPGSFLYKPAAGTVLTGSIELEASFTPSDSNYAGKWVRVFLTVE